MDGHVGDGGGQEDDDDRDDKSLAMSNADGENTGHASMPLNSTDLSSK